MSPSWPRDVFDRIHARGDDPWSVQSSPYELAKYEHTLAALPRPRFSSGLEVGCSIGVQTRQLAGRCERLLALDVASEAVRRARARCADSAHVEIREAQVPRDWPPGVFDLILLSEVLYFLDHDDIASLVRLVLGSLCRGGVVLVVNWTGPTDTPTTGQEAAALFIARTAPTLRASLTEQREGYRLDLLERLL